MKNEEITIYPPKQLSDSAYIKDFDEYNKMYLESITNPEQFWAKQADENISWFKKWDTVLEHNFSSIGTTQEPYVKFFSGGRLNVSYNCLDRHVNSWKRNKAAIIWQGERDNERRTITYQELHTTVCRFANVLIKHGVKKGMAVTIFMPMIPELPIAMLACARIGAIHSVVFSAFSSDALKERIRNSNSRIVITSDIASHGKKVINLKDKADSAINNCHNVDKVIVHKRGINGVNMTTGRDFWWHEEMEGDDISNQCESVEMESEDPLFILYTSGSTGKPKGVLHTTAGYLLHTTLTFKYIFDVKSEDIFWCTADIGWITGHSYVVYGPLSNGATVLLFEGTPTHPQPDRFWKIIEDYKVSIFYTAPTVIRSLMRLGEDWPRRHDLSSLRILGTVGEPINPEAWLWYDRIIGNKKCPIMDTWWQTETGGIMITPLAGAIPTKPGSASMPFFGVEPEVLKDDGSPADINENGKLVIKKPWPGMIRGLYGDEKNELVKKTYFSMYADKYFTGDGCRKDKDGFYWITGRIDDVINVSGHRFSTAEIESSLVAHESVTEAAVVGYPHDIKGQGIYCFVTLKQGLTPSDSLKKLLIAHVREEISPIATPDKIQFSDALPKTRSGKIMRRILRKIGEGEFDTIGDVSTLADPTAVESLIKGRV